MTERTLASYSMSKAMKDAMLWLLYSRGEIKDPYREHGASYPRNFRTWQGLEERGLVAYEPPAALGGVGRHVLTDEGLWIARELLELAKGRHG